MSYDKCVASVGATLKERGFENHDKLAANMCNMWADENGVERTFGRTLPEGEKRRTFALSLGEDMSISSTVGSDYETVAFPVIAITSGLHEYDEDDIEQLLGLFVCYNVFN